MKVLILGAGVVGVTSAYYLARAGHEVEVVDRQTGAGLETSFANAGQVSFGYSSPWAAPGIPFKALKWMFQQHAPLVVRPKLDPLQWSWMLQMLKNCTASAYETNKSRMVRVADYSRSALADLRAETSIEYDHRERGTLQIFRTQKQLDHVGDDLKVLKQYGVPYEVLDAAGCVAAEPALARVKEKFVGGLRLPQDETGDAHIFTQRLAAICEGMGVTFRYGTKIERLALDQGDILGVVTDQGLLTADRYLLALGSYSPQLLAPLRLNVPVYPVKGYSITMPVVDAEAAPVSTVMDETYKIAITRLGDRIRVGGTAEIAGFDLRLHDERRDTLLHSVMDLYPQGGDPARALFWCGLRPMTPDGTPIIGPTRYSKLFLNTGHGTLGWTMSCGSGKLAADLVTGQRPNIQYEDLALSRYAA
ncbi:D-amino acid dehydrogenase small subunit [Pseudoroseomonas deserti]|uniref:D-amino acid dehydrogenase n=1 Tax=Teichococcus deserti TaxID=1817963 RepID=A0A1V2GX14_9PROT|nr:D-amino acid dehydrogenase [Pseudoroseomonas deserti]ONG48231.1 D-amino acid dehydrogenase small subunit [Pseudoroseomonas deserti]